ncbi:MAG: molybdopterin biosynthesis protein [Chitinophagales bacterium]
MGRKVYIDNMPLGEAIQTVIKRVFKDNKFEVKKETIPVVESLGRITAEPVWAKKSSPHFSASAMDGIAVRSSDTFGATETSPVFLKRDRDFIEVDTGDPVPQQFDAVVMIEDVNFKDIDTVELILAAVPWQHIRSVGEDVVEAQMILPAGFRVGPYEIGAFLTAGVSEVLVTESPQVIIIPTGTELVNPGTETGAPGEITDSNSWMLAALCKEWGATPVRFPIVIDDRDALKDAVSRAVSEGDMVVVCSGSSAGREDFTADTIANLGELVLHGIATRPGKPMIFGMVNQRPVLGVPGYPVSASLIFELFAQPIINGMQGHRVPQTAVVEARLARKMASNMGTYEFVHVNMGRIGKEYVAFPLNRGAGITTSLVKSDGELHIPQGEEGYQAGENVTIYLKRPLDLIDRTLLAIGSHDMALDYLGNVLWRRFGLRLSSTNVGSMGGVMALKRHETHIAGIHLLDTDTGDYNVSYLQRYLKGERFKLINLVIREQGLMVKPGNPLGIQSIEDVSEKGLRFVNRQKGAGTRILLDYLLSQKGIAPVTIHGYTREEYSHLAVAAAVAGDTADASLGIYASARAMGLDFIPVAQERYDLCILPELPQVETMEKIIEAIKSPEFIQEVVDFGGYDLSLSGQVMWEN